MNLKFHQKTFTLLGLQPDEFERTSVYVDEVEQQSNIQLPAAVREWYSIANIETIMKEFFGNHVPVGVSELSNETNYHTEHGFEFPLLHVLYENQGVWTMAVLLSDEDDPPVFLGYPDNHNDSRIYEWLLHADRFSDFICAWAWDYVQWWPHDGAYYLKAANIKRLIHPVTPNPKRLQLVLQLILLIYSLLLIASHDMLKMDDYTAIGDR